MIRYCFCRSWCALCTKFAIWGGDKNNPLPPLSMKKPYHHPLSEQKQPSALTVYALESVLEPRYRSENADAARKNYQSERLRRTWRDGKCASKNDTIYLKICDGGDGSTTFQLSELLGAQEHRGHVSPIGLPTCNDIINCAWVTLLKEVAMATVHIPFHTLPSESYQWTALWIWT